MNLFLLALIVSLDPAPPAEYVYYFPIVSSSRNTGAEIWQGSAEKYADTLAEMRPAFVRYNASDYSTINADMNALQDYPVYMVFDAGEGCERLQPNEYSGRIDQMSAFVTLYGLAGIELWNEPDNRGGIDNLYGCWGTEYSAEFIAFISLAVSELRAAHPDLVIGVSFAGYGWMFRDVCTLGILDFCGLHWYGYYGAPFTDKYTSALQASSAPVWVTETNLLYGAFNEADCLETEYQEAQREWFEYVYSIARGPVVPYVLHPPTNTGGLWRCAFVWPDTPAWEFIR